GEVPTRVTRPPSRDAKDIGIKSRDGDVPVRLAVCSAMGMRIASAPTFLVAMESKAVAATNTGAWLCALFSRGVIGRRIASMTPEREAGADHQGAGDDHHHV